ncbi:MULTISPECIES: hypothetical protein [unclassified Mycobacterium]|uniref:hypothetical protein n=1 Tax=unclassified Mycobacterium TaxID=2642494 RepID=UPI0009927993|nr:MULTISPECIES: hypothetical protein [unclassified Mycobacterium]
MRAAVVGEWIVVTGGWVLFHTLREQALTPTLARQVAEWCDEQRDYESAAEIRWAAGEAEKIRPEPQVGQLPVGQTDDIIARIDEMLSAPYAGFDSMTWSPMSESEKERILAGEQDETDEQPRILPVGQIHAIPADQVSEWRGWWDGLSASDQRDIQWYVVCFQCGVVGERSVDCVCQVVP